MSKVTLEKKKSNVIAMKPNRVIQAGQQMSPFQQKVFIGALALLEFNLNSRNPNDEIDRISKTTFSIPARELFDDFKSLRLSQNAEFTKDIEQKVDDLIKQSIKIREQGSFTAINIMDYAKFDYDKETINIQFSKAIVPVLLDMFNEGFTKIRLVSFMKFRSGYSMRFYEELLRVKNMDNVIKYGHTLTIYELFFLLGLDRDKEYRKYDHFRQRVLLPAQKEIREKAGLLFEFEEIRRGKPVYQIRFYDIKDDPNFVQEPRQLSLFPKETNFPEPISEPEDNFLIPILQNAKENIIEPNDKIENSDSKFTEEQMEKLDKYLEGVFSADEIKNKHSFDYIEFYYKKIKDLDDKNMVQDFPNFFYNLLKEDKHKYYELNAKKIKQEEKKIAKEKAEKEMKKRKEQEEKVKSENEKAEQKKWEAAFDSLDEEKKKMYLEKLYALNELYKNFDKTGISDWTKWAIGKMIDDEQQ